MEQYITPITYEAANLGKKITKIEIDETLITNGPSKFIGPKRKSKKLSEVS